jgi:hypothetical protein
MTAFLKIRKDWEFNVLGVYNYRKTGPYDCYLQFIKENFSTLEGDIVEAGVYQGKTLLSTALLLKELGSNKIVYGYDTFTGFPPIYHLKDNLKEFESLLLDGKISKTHYDAVIRNRKWRETLQMEKMTTANLSSSGTFSGTSEEFVQRKKNLIGLNNIKLVGGTFEKTMQSNAKEPTKIMAVLMDCDLYQSYIETFNFVWPRLVIGGLIYLDEYYSLKFPGGKIATDEFIKNKKAKLIKAKQKRGDFERWYLIKEG